MPLVPLIFSARLEAKFILESNLSFISEKYALYIELQSCDEACAPFTPILIALDFYFGIYIVLLYIVEHYRNPY